MRLSQLSFSGGVKGVVEAEPGNTWCEVMIKKRECIPTYVHVDADGQRRIFPSAMVPK